MASFLFFTLFLIQTTIHDSENEIPLISEELIAEHTTYFEILDNRIEDAGPLLTALEHAHYVALGELHNRLRLGELTESLLHVLASHGFNHFAIETGPYSAQKLQQLIRSGRPEVSAFYANYSSKLFDFIPIPFFKGKSDLQFLSAADSLGYELWGLDQEFYFSYAYLIDELAGLAGESITEEQEQLQRKLTRRLYRMKRRNQLFSRFQLSCRLKSDEQVQAYLHSFNDVAHPDVQQILEAFHTTLEIYCLAEQGEPSEPIRISYFRENFERNFEAALTENPEPKVFLKMGSYHMGRQRSPLNIYDIGNHIHHLAESNSQSSVHIFYLNRFLEGNDMIRRRGWENSDHFISVGNREKWALTDLRLLREQLLNGTLHGNDYEELTIMNYDFIIIAPEDEWVRRHW